MENTIQDTSWVWQFIRNVVCGDSSKADQYMAEKMSHINRLFYKYCSVCEESKRTEETIEYNILNFENDELFFQNPSLFNDPFDCYMGISQNETIKNLLITAMKQQKKFTPQMRKTINAFFSRSASLEIEPDEENLESILSNAMPLILSAYSPNDEEQKFILEEIKELSSDANLPLFIKFLQGKATVADQQAIVDILYQNSGFQEYIKQSIEGTDHFEWILKAGKQDVKLKIEKRPDTIIVNDNTEPPQFIDMLRIFRNSMIGKQQFPELDTIMEQFKQISNVTLAKTRQIISQQCRVACLSERMDSPLMWSHYANKHFGFCLEYDFTYSSIATIRKYPDIQMAKIILLPVIYTDKRPSLSQSITSPKAMNELLKTKKLPAETIAKIVFGLLHKGIDWSYEREWRMIGVNMTKPAMKLPPPRKLFLGANIEETTKKRLVEIAKTKHIPVYQMCLSPDRYKLESYKVE